MCPTLSAFVPGRNSTPQHYFLATLQCGWAGQTHLNAPENLKEIGVVPARLLPPARDAAPLGLGMLEEVERRPCVGTRAKHRKVRRGVTGRDTTLILMKTNIEDPMDPILSAPMTANRLAKGGSREEMAEQVEAVLARLFLSNPPLGVDNPNGLQPRQACRSCSHGRTAG